MALLKNQQPPAQKIRLDIRFLHRCNRRAYLDGDLYRRLRSCILYDQRQCLLINVFRRYVRLPIRRDEVKLMHFDEGQLEWVDIAKVHELPIPETDQKFMWPLVKEHRGGFFMVHIDCTVQPMTWTVTESKKATGNRQ